MLLDDKRMAMTFLNVLAFFEHLGNVDRNKKRHLLLLYPSCSFS